jgi:tetratricopeptide (TPR) repeat protein
MSDYVTPLRDKINYLWVTGQLVAMLQLSKKVLAAARSDQQPPVEALALVSLASVHRGIGKFYEARVFAEGAALLAARLGNREVLCDAYGELGATLLEGYFQAHEAEACFHQALELAGETAYRRGTGAACVGLARCYAALGVYRAASDCAAQALNIARETLDSLLEVQALWVYAHSARRAHQYTLALNALQAARALCEKLSYRLYIPLLDVELGLIAYEDSGNGVRLIQQAYDTAQDQRHYFAQVAALHAMLDIALRTDHQHAYRYANELLNMAQRVNSRPHEASAFAAIGAVEASRRQYEQAVDAYQQALSIARATTNPFQELHALEALGALYAEAEDFEAALAHYEAGIRAALAVDNQHRAGALRRRILMVRLRRFFVALLRLLGLRQR